MSLSVVANSILQLHSPDAYATLVVPGSASLDADAMLGTIRPEELFDRPILNTLEAQCALAGLWLWHDFLDRAHRIVQAIDTPAGSYWHAILHRREGDFSNCRYWLARSAGHPVLAGFDSRALVTLVERRHDRPELPQYREAVELQRREWRILFDHTVAAALGADNPA